MSAWLRQLEQTLEQNEKSPGRFQPALSLSHGLRFGAQPPDWLGRSGLALLIIGGQDMAGISSIWGRGAGYEIPV